MTATETARIRPVDDFRTYKMPASMQLGPPTIRISSLQRALSFYEENMRLEVKGQHQDNEDGLDRVGLGFHASKEPLLLLKHRPNAHNTPHDFAGLYHYAILVQDRKA